MGRWHGRSWIPAAIVAAAIALVAAPASGGPGALSADPSVTGPGGPVPTIFPLPLVP